MSLTSVSIVRNHLYRFNPGDETIRNYGMRLSADAFTQLPHTKIADSSERVKAIESDIPVSQTIILEEAPVLLAHQELVSGSFVCANNSSLSRVYQENVDFTVDYTTGTIRRIEEGAITSGQSVCVWYLPYRVYGKNIDYSIDYDRGRLRRLASGDIEDNQELFIDYRLGATQFSDSEIEQCIAEAEAELTLLVDSRYIESVDPALQTAATCLAMSYICRNTAGVVQTGNSVSGKNGDFWLRLADSYRETALRLITPYQQNTPPLQSPQRA